MKNTLIRCRHCGDELTFGPQYGGWVRYSKPGVWCYGKDADGDMRSPGTFKHAPLTPKDVEKQLLQELDRMLEMSV